jgi:peptide/nickel transport system permease protein
MVHTARANEAGPTASRFAGADRRLSGSMLHSVVSFTRRKPLGALGGLIVLFFVFLALFAPAVAPYDINNQVLKERLQPMSWSHPFGTDELGRDVLSRVIYGARTSIVIGFGALVIATLWSTSLGIISGYFGGWFDLIFQRFIDVWQAFPGLILIIALVPALGGGTTGVMIALGIVGGASSSRVMRAGTLSTKTNQYVEAARVVGAGHPRVLLRHIVPNVLYLVIITASLRVGAFILAEASLSFLGFGVTPPTPSWGQMLTGAARNFMVFRPELAIFAGLAITLVVFGFNVLGDALRDVADPRLRRR